MTMSSMHWCSRPAVWKCSSNSNPNPAPPMPNVMDRACLLSQSASAASFINWDVNIAPPCVKSRRVETVVKNMRNIQQKYLKIRHYKWEIGKQIFAISKYHKSQVWQRLFKAQFAPAPMIRQESVTGPALSVTHTGHSAGCQKSVNKLTRIRRDFCGPNSDLWPKYTLFFWPTCVSSWHHPIGFDNPITFHYNSEIMSFCFLFVWIL